MIKLHFCTFLVDFHSARLFLAYYGFILQFLGNFWGSAGVGDEHGSILIFYTFYVFARGIILLVGTVINGFWGV